MRELDDRRLWLSVRWTDDPPPGQGGNRAEELILAVWTVASLLGIALGLGIAKYSQAWAQDSFHPGAVIGSLTVLQSAALTLIAARRCIHRCGRRSGRRSSALLAVLCSSLVIALGWVALAIICLAGWQFPPSRLS